MSVALAKQIAAALRRLCEAQTRTACVVILSSICADGPRRAYKHMGLACSIISRPAILGVGNTIEHLIPHSRLETSRWPNTETAFDILRHEPRRESTRFFRYRSSGRPLDRSLTWRYYCPVASKRRRLGTCTRRGDRGVRAQREKPAWLSTS